jgi:DNA sulfur modification protein DndD
MRITRVIIKNFGPFYKDHEIEFGRDGFGIHVFRGDNGQGKTSLQRAILWGLYGKVLDRNNKEIALSSLLNRTAALESDFSLSVSIHFKHDNGTWCITRKSEAGANKDSLFVRNMQLFITLNSVPQENPQHVIERMLPAEVSRFFFFDGEMLRDYEELLDQESSNMKLLRNSIERILGIPILRIARNDLNQITKETEVDQGRLLKRLGGNTYEQLADDRQIILDSIGSLEKSIKELDTQIAFNEQQTADKKRRQTDIRSVQIYATERNNIDQQIKSLESRKETQDLKLKGLNEKLYKSVLFPIAKNVVMQLEIKHQAVMDKYDKKLQLEVKARSFRHAIEQGKCEFCDTKIQGDKLQQLQLQLDEINEEIKAVTEIPQPNLEFAQYKTVLQSLLTNPLKPDMYSAITIELHNISYDKAKLQARWDELSQRLKDVDEEEPFRIETEIRILIEEHGRLLQEKTQINAKLAEDYSRKSDLDQRMARIDEDELKLLSARIQNCKTIAEIFEKSIGTYTEGRRKEVETQATEIFKQLRSKAEFTRLIINNNFGLSILTKSGTILDKSEWRSAGEEQVVALALIGALNKCSKTIAPVLMDTPFGRLDNNHVGKVLNYLPTMSEQVLLLVTDREFSKADELLLQGKIVSDFTITHKGEREGSVILSTPNEVTVQ